MIALAAILGTTIAEALAVYTVAEWFSAGYAADHRHAVHAVTFVLIALIAFALQRFVVPLATSRRGQGLIAIAATFVVVYGAIRIEFAHDLALWDLGWVADFLRDSEDTLSDGARTIGGSLLLFALWIRTSMRASDEIEMETLPRSVGWAFLVVTAVLIFAAPSTRSGEVARGGAAFYAVAVASLAFAQLSLSGATFGELRAGGTAAMLLGGTVLVTGACLLVFWIVFSLAAGAFGPPLGSATEVVLTAVLTPPAWVIEHVMRWLLGNHNPFDRLAEMAQQQAENARDPNAQKPGDANPASDFGFRALALLIVTGVVLAAIVLASRFRKRGRDRGDEAASGTAGSFREDARGLLAGLFRRGPRQPGRPPGSAAERLYLDVLQRGERAGQPRLSAETPAEYAPRLETALNATVTNEITAAFVEARYAGREPDPRTLAELERRWREVR